MEPAAFLRAQSPGIVDDALASVERWYLHHYRAAGAKVTRERLVSLLDAVLASLESRDLRGIDAHAGEVARQRFHAGFGLAEVQTAFNVLEEALWLRIVRERPAAGHAEALGLVATVLGAGKDRLALTWAELASGKHEAALDVKALFRGTLGGPAFESAEPDR